MNTLERATKRLFRRALCTLLLGILMLIVGRQHMLASSGDSANPIALQQEHIKVQGVVVDKTGESVIGATIQLIADKAVGTITDIDGNFSISVPLNSTIEVRSLGYASQRKKITDETKLHIVLLENQKVLDEVVVVGYATQKRVNLTGAVNSINVNKQLESRPITDVGRALQGAAPGLSIKSGSGKIGGGPEMFIRGEIGSLSGSHKPLILLDNVEIADLSIINPDDVESISVLKDAASSSIYGTRAAFGVILITTKKAKTGERFKVNYSTNFAWAKPTITPEIAKTYEGAELSMMAAQRVNPNVNLITNNANLLWDMESIERMKEWDRVYGGMKLGPEMVLGRDFEIKDGKPHFYRGFDPVDLFIKKNSLTQQHNLSVNGTSSNTSYNLALGYLGQTGSLKVNPDKYDRYNVSFGTNTELNKWVSVRSKLIYSRTTLDTPNSFTAENYDAWYYMYRFPRIMPFGTYEGRPFRNIITEMEQANMDTRTNNYTRINLGTTFNIMKGLSLDADYTFAKTDRIIHTRGGQAEGLDYWGGNGIIDHVWTGTASDRVKKDSQNSDAHTGNIVARFNKTFKEDHVLTVLGGSNIEYYTNTNFSAERRGLIDNSLPEFNLAIGDQFASGSHTQWASLGFFGRINYVYKNRYLLELNGRYDGSSRFPLDKLWGFFPSMSAGYIITEEAFMEPLKHWLSFAKLRFSYGSIGNQDVGNYEFLPIMARPTSAALSGWIVDNSVVTTLDMPKAIANGYTWETITTANLGIDTRFVNDKFGVSLDIYQRVNSNLITGTATDMPSTYGTIPPKRNFGELTARGLELSVDFRHKFSNGLNLNVIATLSDGKTKVTKFPVNNKVITGSNYEGRVIGEIWGFETDRFFTAGDFDTDPYGNLVLNPDLPSQALYEKTSGLPWFQYGPGDIKYKDLNGDGVISRGEDTVDNPGDQKIIGNTQPRYEYSSRVSLDWKGFDLDIFFQGVGKREMWGNGSIFIPGYLSTDAWYSHQLDYWTPENPNAFYPRVSNLAQSNNSQNFMKQTKYLLDMSYCRLKNVTFGYTLPRSLIKKAMINNLRFYVSFENVFEIHNLGDIPIDPETDTVTGDGGYVGRSYPYARTASFGLQLTF